VKFKKKKKTSKPNTLAFKGGGGWGFRNHEFFCDKLSSHCFSFFLSTSTVATHNFISPTYIATIISLEPYALNAEFQHFIPRFNKIYLLSRYPWKRGLGVKGDPKIGDYT
jgi:hypothetical protein